MRDRDLLGISTWYFAILLLYSRVVFGLGVYRNSDIARGVKRATVYYRP